MIREKKKKSASVLWQKPLHSQKIPNSNVKTQTCHQNFDYTTIADGLRAVSWSNDSNKAVVVKPEYGIPTFPITAKAV